MEDSYKQKFLIGNYGYQLGPNFTYPNLSETKFPDLTLLNQP